jgi:hypothetical protein
LSAALAHDNRADLDLGATKDLDAETLAGRISTVGGGTTDLLGSPSALQRIAERSNSCASGKIKIE